MNTEKALELVNQATGLNLKVNELRWHPQACIWINNIEKTAEMVERMGGELRSRQAIATIIALSPEPQQDNDE